MIVPRLKNTIKSVIVLFLCLGLWQDEYSDRSVYSSVSESQINAIEKVKQLELADGDLVFRNGDDFATNLVLSQGNNPQFAHVGVVIKQNNSTYVVHSVPNDSDNYGGVIIEPLSSFIALENASRFAIYRTKGLDSASRNQVKQYVLKQIGKSFDHRLLMSEDSEIYCTELALKAFASAGLNLITTLPSLKFALLPEPVVPPDHLRDSENFELLL